MDKARAFYPSVGYKQIAVTVIREDPHFEAYTLEKHLGRSAALLNSNSVEVTAVDTVDTKMTCSSIDIVVRQFRAEDMEQVVALFNDGMMDYPAHKMHAEGLQQHITEIITTGDLSSIEATYITPGGNFGLQHLRRSRMKWRVWWLSKLRTTMWVKYAACL